MSDDIMSDFHGQMVNLPTVPTKMAEALEMDHAKSTETSQREMIYKLGHRDARHAAAEVCNAADQKIARLQKALTELREEHWQNMSRQANEIVDATLADTGQEGS